MAPFGSSASLDWSTRWTTPFSSMTNVVRRATPLGSSYKA